MSKATTSRKQRAKILWMKRAIQTCFLLAFSIWVVNQLKLYLVNGNAKTGLTSEFFKDMPKFMPNEPIKLSRKTLRIDTEVLGARNQKEGNKEDGNEERVDYWIEDFDNPVVEKGDAVNDTSNGVHRAENMEDGWEMSLVEKFECLDSSVSAFDQDDKEDSLDVEALEETTRIEEVSQEDDPSHGK